MTDPVYDDGSHVEIECEEAEPMRGPYVDSHDVLDEATDEDRELGVFLGQMIDVDDDTSDGSEWAGVTREELEAMAADQ